MPHRRRQWACGADVRARTAGRQHGLNSAFAIIMKAGSDPWGDRWRNREQPSRTRRALAEGQRTRPSNARKRQHADAWRLARQWRAMLRHGRELAGRGGARRSTCLPPAATSTEPLVQKSAITLNDIPGAAHASLISSPALPHGCRLADGTTQRSATRPSGLRSRP